MLINTNTLINLNNQTLNKLEFLKSWFWLLTLILIETIIKFSLYSCHILLHNYYLITSIIWIYVIISQFFFYTRKSSKFQRFGKAFFEQKYSSCRKFVNRTNPILSFIDNKVPLLYPISPLNGRHQSRWICGKLNGNLRSSINEKYPRI